MSISDQTLDLPLLRAFLALAESGNFTRTGERLGRSQSAVSLQIRRLEDALGQRLFERDGRGAHLTPAGERLLPDARRLLAVNDEMLARLRAARVEGHVRLGASDDFAQVWLPELIGRFARSHGDVRLDVAIETSEQLRQGLAEGRFDLTFARCWPGDGGGEVVWRQGLRWVAADWLELDAAAPVPLVASPAPCLVRRAMLEALEAKGRTWRLTGESVFTNGLQATIMAGLGVTALGDSTLLPGMRVLTPAEGFPALAASEIVLAVARRPSAATRALVAYVRERLPLRQAA